MYLALPSGNWCVLMHKDVPIVQRQGAAQCHIAHFKLFSVFWGMSLQGSYSLAFLFLIITLILILLSLPQKMGIFKIESVHKDTSSIRFPVNCKKMSIFSEPFSQTIFSF